MVFGWQDASNPTIERGLAEITEGRVTATISFLASDELAGRATGSSEFNIAAKYVASRFQGAGLDGSLADGDFYHVTMKQLTKTPSGPVSCLAPICNPLHTLDSWQEVPNSFRILADSSK